MKNTVHLKQLFAFWSLKKSMIDTIFFSLCKSPLCHILSNDFEMSKNIPQTSRPSSKRFVNFMRDGQKLVNIRTTWLKTWLVRRYYFLQRKMFIHVTIQYSFKYFSSNRKQRYWTVVFQVLFLSFFVCWNHLAFFHSVGDFSWSKD